MMTPLPKYLAKLKTAEGTMSFGTLLVTIGKSVVNADEARMTKMAPIRRPMEPV